MLKNKTLLKMCLVLGIGAITVMPSVAQVQEENLQEEYTLKEALEYALKYNTQIQNAELTEIEKDIYTKEVKSAVLPQFNGSASYTDNYLLPVLILPAALAGGEPGTTQQIQVGTQHNVAAGVQLSQQVFNQSVFTGLKAAKASERYYQLNTELTEEQVIEGISQLYYQVLITKQQKEFVERNLEQTDKLLKVAESQLENGVIKKIDLSRIKVNRTNLESQLQNLENAYSKQLNLLKYNMGMSGETEITLADAEIEIPATQADLGDDFLNDHTQLELLDQQRELTLLEQKSFKAGYFPTLSLSMNYQYQGVSNELDFLGENSPATWYDVGSIGVNLSVPIFDGFKKSRQLQQSKIRMQKLENSMRDTKERLEVEYNNALNDMISSRTNLEAQQENMKLATEVYNVTQETYQYGLASLTDLLNAETALTQAQTEYAQALLNNKVSEINLLKSKGDLKTLVN